MTLKNDIQSASKRLHLRRYLVELHTGDRQKYYKHLFIALVLLILLEPVMSGWAVGRVLELAVVLCLLAAGSLAVRGKSPSTIFAVSMGLIMIITGSLRFLSHEPNWVTLLWLLSGALFLSNVTFVLARDIFTSSNINSGHLYGAVSIYLLVGLVFSNIHFALETIAPGSYHCGSPQCDAEFKPPAYLYYSMITLATVGYGDIVPASRVAGMLSYLEAIVGQMYVAILVARLVGMHLSVPKA